MAPCIPFPCSHAPWFNHHSLTPESLPLRSCVQPSESESHSAVPNSLRPIHCSPWDSPGQNTGIGSRSLLQWVYPTQGSNPGLPPCRQILYHLSHQGSPGVLEWVAYPFSSRSSWQVSNWGLLHCRQILLPAELLGKPTSIVGKCLHYYMNTTAIVSKGEIIRRY